MSGYVVEGFWSQNVVIKGVYVRNPFTYSIAMVDTTDFCVDDNNVDVTGTINRYNQLDGIHILDSNSGQVINNSVVSGDDGLVAHRIGWRYIMFFTPTTRCTAGSIPMAYSLQ